jgi:elongation factor 1-alpha
LAKHSNSLSANRVKDDGTLTGLEQSEMEETVNTLDGLVRRARLRLVLVEPIQVAAGNFICQAKIGFGLDQADGHSVPPLADLKVVLLGDSDSGKSTLISVLAEYHHDQLLLDDGKGRMRARLLHHRHELLSGATSSIAIEPLVYASDRNGQSVAPVGIDPGLPGIERARLMQDSRVVNLVDSAGKLRFDHTVLSILTAVQRPDLALVVLEAPTLAGLDQRRDESGQWNLISPESLDTIALVQCLDIPVALVISKIDQSTTELISLLLEELVSAGLAGICLYSSPGSELPAGKIPVLLCSAVSGEYLDVVADFLGRWRPASLNGPQDWEYLKEAAEAALLIDQHHVQESLGEAPLSLVYGQVAFGALEVGDALQLGPLPGNSSQAALCRVVSIHRVKAPVSLARAGQYVTLALAGLPKATKLNRGMALMRPKSNLSSAQPHSVSKFRLRPLRRLIAQISRANIQTGPVFVRPFTDKSTLQGTVFVGGQKFAGNLHLPEAGFVGDASVCIITSGSETSRKKPAKFAASDNAPVTSRRFMVCLQPGSAVVFVEGSTGRRYRFVGRIIDYFA